MLITYQKKIYIFF